MCIFSIGLRELTLFSGSVEMKVVPIQHTSTLGRQLRKTMTWQQNDVGVPHESDADGVEVCKQLPRACVDRLPGAFELAGASITLHGVDLPNLLPRSAGTPQRQVLLSVKGNMMNATAEVLLLSCFDTLTFFVWLPGCRVRVL